MTEEQDWLEFLRRWDALIAGLRGRYDDQELDQIHFEGIQEPFLGIGTLLGGHEQGMDELTPAEEDELWELASLTRCADDDLLDQSVRARSVRNRPIRKVQPKHPLRGGGHGARSGKPGKRAFPASWTDDQAIEHTMDVARQPSGAMKLPTGDFVAHGERAGVLLGVVVAADGEVLTSYPVRGPGVVDNPMDEFRGPAALRLQSLLQDVMAEDHELRALLDELHAVGEWPYVVSSLVVLDPPMTEEQRSELRELAHLAGLPESTP